MADSTPKRARVKPAKPRPDWPLFPHNNGSWAKKIKGRLIYFGPWSDPGGALQRYQDVLAGKPRGPDPGTLTVGDGVNLFLGWKETLLNSGELAGRTFRDYCITGRRLIEFFGRDRPIADLTPSDFEALRAALAKTLGPATLKVNVIRVRAIFKYLADSEKIDRPARFGPAFRPPAARTVRKSQNGSGPKLFTPPEIHTLLQEAPPQLAVMILLGLNCGYGNSDISRLTTGAIVGEWVDFPRPKTGIPRRCWLWPETRAAVDLHLTTRETPVNPSDADLVFLTGGLPWVRSTGRSWVDKVSDRFRRLVKQVRITRPGATFYDLRRTFRTIADGCRDEPAVDMVMGHTRADMGSVYRQTIGDDRIRAVCEHVRRWLFDGGEVDHV